MKKLIILSLAALVLLSSSVAAQEAISVETDTSADGADTFSTLEHYAFPEIKPEIKVSAGYRLVGSSGSARAEEYEYLHSSPLFGLNLAAYPFPHRLHLDLEFKNKKDYFGDMGYAYEDMILFRGINRTLYHNLDGVNLIDLDPATASPGVSVRDTDGRYGVRFGMSSAFLRFKKHDFPFHVYIDGTLVDREGSIQQRSLQGSGYFNDIVRTSQTRRIDMQTTNVTVGMNSHLGPVEVDISHGEMRHDVGGDRVMYDQYTAASSLSPRGAGEYPHNLLPEYKGASNTLKLHSSYTGSLVASATVSKSDRENRDSGAKADYFIGSGEVSWHASPQVALFVKYRHKEIELDVPSTVTITDRLNPSNTYTYAVEPSIPSMTDTLSAIARMRPIPGVTLLADYTYENVRRDVSFEWNVPSSTRRNSVTASANLRVVRGLAVKASFSHKAIDDPAYNTEPDRSNEARLSVTWTPRPRLTALLSYSLVSEKRDDLSFVDAPSALRRDARRNSLLSSVTVAILNNLSASASYAYTDNKVRQDIVYHDTAGAALVDPFVPFKDMAHSYGLSVTYAPVKPLALLASVTHTIGSSIFYPADPNLTQPVSVAAYSAVKTRETVYAASGEYSFKSGFAAGLQYRYSDFRDVLDNPYDDLINGRAHIILVTVSKKW